MAEESDEEESIESQSPIPHEELTPKAVKSSLLTELSALDCELARRLDPFLLSMPLEFI